MKLTVADFANAADVLRSAADWLDHSLRRVPDEGEGKDTVADLTVPREVSDLVIAAAGRTPVERPES